MHIGLTHRKVGKTKLGAVEIAQGVKALPSKNNTPLPEPEDLGSSLRIHIKVKGES